MKHIVLTRRHILDALEVKPHVFRKWTERLEPYRSQPTKVRVSREFNRRDLLFFCVIKSLITDFEMSIDVIGRFSGSLAECLAKPTSAVSPGCLFIQAGSSVVAPLRTQASESGTVIELTRHIHTCNAFFDTDETEQASLPFGLTDMSAASKKG